MASSYSTDLKLELMVTGENAGTWGDNTNNNLNLIQQAIAGYEAVALTDGGTVALAMTDKTISNARNMVIKFTGTLTTASTVTIPDSIEKFYIFDCSAVVAPTNLTIKTASGTGFTLDAAKIYAAYSDGTNLNEISLDTLGGTIGTAQIADNAITSAKISANQITTAKISDNQITTAKISDNQITTAKISDNQITTAKIADDQVTADKLADTAVTPGSYTTANITVDAQGRITSASSGSGGSAGFVQTLLAEGPASGTFTAGPGVTKVFGYFAGAGGGGGKRSSPPGAEAGGSGAYGVFYISGTAPQFQSVPYSIGAGGGGGQNQGASGQSGQASNFGTLLGANAGSGGSSGPAGGQAANGNFNTGTPYLVLNQTPGPIRNSSAGGFAGAGQPGSPAGGDPANPQSPGGTGGSGILNLYESRA